MLLTILSITCINCWSLSNVTGLKRQLAVLLDVDLLVAVDHDFGDVLAREQFLERPETENIVDQDLDESKPIRPAHRDVLLGDHVVEQLGDALAHDLRGYRVGALGELFHETLVHLAAQRHVGIDVSSHLANPGRDIAPARFSSVGARCGSGAAAGRSTSHARGAARAARIGCGNGAGAPPGRFCQPAGGNRSAPSSDGRSGVPEGADGRRRGWVWKPEGFPLPSAALGRATT